MAIGQVAAGSNIGARRPPDPFAGTVIESGWSFGQGAHRPGEPNIPFGLYVKVETRPGIAVTAGAVLNKKTNTVTITVHSRGEGPTDVPDKQTRLHVNSPAGLQLGKDYKLVVKDDTGKVLDTGKFHPMIAMAPRQ